mgnify:CR=1 FL=1
MFSLYDLINTFGYVILVNLLVSFFFEKKHTSKKYIPVVWLITWYVVDTLICMIFQDNIVVRIIMTNVVAYLCCSFRYKGKPLTLFFTIFMGFNILLLPEFLTYTVGMKFWRYNSVEEMNMENVSVLLGTASQILSFFLIIVIGKVKGTKSDSISKSLWIKFSVLPLLTLVTIGAYFLFIDGEVSESQKNFYTVFSIILTVMNIYMYYTFSHEIRNASEISRLREGNKYTNELSNLYMQICREHDALSSSEHEYKNKIALISKLIETEDYDALKKFVTKENSTFEKNANVINTGNTVITSIFNAKYSEARSKDIQIRFDIGNLSEVKIDDNDLVILLFNLLNNAIEACEKCSPDVRLISIMMKHEKQMFFLSVSNTFNGDVNKSQDRYLSTKDDSVHHGYGIENIKKIFKIISFLWKVNADPFT